MARTSGKVPNPERVMTSALSRDGRERPKAGPPPTTRILPASYITAPPFCAVGPRLPAGTMLPVPSVVYQFICVLGPAWNTAQQSILSDTSEIHVSAAVAMSMHVAQVKVLLEDVNSIAWPHGVAEIASRR